MGLGFHSVVRISLRFCRSKLSINLNLKMVIRSRFRKILSLVDVAAVTFSFGPTEHALLLLQLESFLPFFFVAGFLSVERAVLFELLLFFLRV